MVVNRIRVRAAAGMGGRVRAASDGREGLEHV